MDHECAIRIRVGIDGQEQELSGDRMLVIALAAVEQGTNGQTLIGGSPWLFPGLLEAPGDAARTLDWAAREAHLRLTPTLPSVPDSPSVT